MKTLILSTVLTVFSLLSFGQVHVRLTGFGGPGFDNCNPSLTEIPVSIRPVVSSPSGVSTSVRMEIRNDSTKHVFYKDTTVIGKGTEGVWFTSTIMVALTGPGVYNLSSYVTVEAQGEIDSSSGGDGWPHYSIVYKPAACKTISGRMYWDRNGNCTFDAGDSVFANQGIKDNYNEAARTDANGQYSFIFRNDYSNLIAVERVVTCPSGQHLTIGCHSSPGFVINSQNDTTVDFIYGDSLPTRITNWETFTSPDYRICPTPYRATFYSTLEGNVGVYDIHFYFGDGHDSIYHIDYSIPQASIFHEYTDFGTFHPYMKIVFPDTVLTRSFDEINYMDDCGPIQGIIYKDINGNCLYDNAIEEGFPGVRVECELKDKTKLYTYTDSAGRYYFNTPDTSNFLLYIPGTDASGKYIFFYNELQVCSNSKVNFGIKCESSTSQDFQVQSYPGMYRPGRDHSFYSYVTNVSCDEKAGTLSITLGAKESFNSAQPAPARVNGNVLEWDFSPINSYDRFQVMVFAHMDSTVALGDNVCHLAVVNPISGDANPADNTLHSCAEVRASYDPNDKTAYLAKNSKELGDVLQSETDLVYRIRFQNTGNDTAFNIYVLDTLDQNIIMNSFHVISSSHPMKTFTNDDRVVRFQFSDINLPDDKMNEPKSHGELYYSVSRDKSLEVGDKVKNTAYIYFDYNDPIITNTSVVTVVAPTSIGVNRGNEVFKAFPNPASDKITVILPDNNEGRLLLIDVTGRELLSQEIKGNGTLDLGRIPNGVYVITVHSKLGESSGKVIITR